MMGAKEEDAELEEPETNGAAKKKKRSKKKKKEKGKEVDQEDNGDEVVEQDAGLLPNNHLACEDMPEEFVDITPDFLLATAAMHVGEMIESPTFRLYDAMSAIEIMDPKMDSGYGNDQDMTLESAISTGAIQMPQSLGLDQLVTIWDQLLMHYLLWMEGHTIVQTIFTCMYLHDMEQLIKPFPLFGAFIDAFLAACRCAREVILTAQVYEDEDFAPGLFNIDLQACVFSVEPKDILSRIEQECKELGKQKSNPMATAAMWRLDFIGQYLFTLLELSGKLRPAKQTFASTLNRLVKSAKLLDQITGSLKSRPLDVLRAFDASINRKLLVPGPPRTVKPIDDFALVWSRWSSHLQELTACCTLTEKNLCTLVEGALVQKDEAGVLPRSLAQVEIVESGVLRQLCLDSLSEFLFPMEALQHCNEAVEAFLERCEAIFEHLLKLSHMNRARRFRRLAHVFVDFNAMQHEAWRLDDDLRTTFQANLRYQRPCWVWIMEMALQSMLKKLFLGFELDLYDQAEFHMIYWYADYLYGLRVYNMAQVCCAKEQAQGDKKKKTPAARSQQDKRSQNKPRNPPAELLLLEATQNTVRGLFRLLAFCLKEGLTKLPSSGVDGLAQRFVLRFRPLEHFRLPHLPSFKDFQLSSASTQTTLESKVVLDAALDSFKHTAELIDKVSSAKDSTAASCADSAKALKRVVVANQLAIVKLSQALFGPSPRKRVKVSAVPTHHLHLVSVQVEQIEET